MTLTKPILKLHPGGNSFPAFPPAKALWLSTLLLFLMTVSSRAATITWTNGNATGVWSDPLNWDSGTVPGAADDAVFNATSVDNCSIDGINTIKSLNIDGTYSGSVSLGANTLTVSSSFTIANASGFDAGTGIVVFSGQLTCNSAAAVYNLELNTLYASDNISLSQNLEVNNTLTITQVRNINNNDIRVHGNIVSNDAEIGGTGDIAAVGNTHQTLTGTGTLSRLHIDKTGGNLQLPADFTLFHNNSSSGNISLTGSGRIENTGGKLIFGDHGIIDFSGSIDDLEITSTPYYGDDLILNQDLEVNNTLTITDIRNINNKDIRVHGNIESNDPEVGGTGFIAAVGNANQTLSGTGMIANLEASTAGGPLLLLNDFTISSALAGTGDIVGNTNVEKLIIGGSSNASLNSSGTVENLRIEMNSNYNLTLNQVMTVTEDLEIVQVRFIGGSELRVNGNIDVTDTNIGGSGTLVMTGTANNTFTGVGGSISSKLIVRKDNSTAKAILATSQAFGGNIIVDEGLFEIGTGITATGTITVQSGGTLVGNGTATGNVSVNSSGTLAPGASPGCLTINGNLVMNSGSTLNVEIDGDTPCTNHDQLVVNGTVTINGATLTGTTTTAPSGSITIIDNDAADGIAGSKFSGAPEGGTINIGGSNYVVSYIGGDGNDMTLTGNTPPIAVCQNVTVNADASCKGTATAADIDDGSSDPEDGVPSLSISPAGPFALGNTTVTLTATDSQGETSTCQATVTVVDATNPTITCPAAVSVNTDAGACAATNVALGSETAADNCGFTVTNDAPASYPVGTTTVTWTVTDGSGNTASCTQTVTVADDENPTITCPANVTVAADAGSCEATGVSLGSLATADNCSVASTGNDSSEPYALGATTVTWTVTDGSGNTATCAQTVTVADNEAPTAACQNITVQLDANGNATATAAQVNNGSSDNCGSVSLSLSQTSFDCSDLNLPAVNDYGEVIVNYVGGTATYVLTQANLVNWNGWGSCSGNQRFISTGGLEGWTWTDNLAPGTVVNSVEINLSFDFSGTGATKPYYLNNVNEGTSPGPPDALDCSSVINSFTLPGTNYIVGGPNTFSWDFIPYTYLLIKGSVIANAGVPVVLTVTDGAGNQSTCNAVVSVEDNINPTITCPAAVSANTDAGACAATNVALGSETAADNCGFTVTNNAPASYPVGTTTVTWTVTDGSGNTASCTQTVTIADNENPTITCPANVTVNTNSGVCEATGVSLGTPATADNCTVASTVNNASEPYALGATTVTWTVTDGSGNTATCPQTVTVEDNEGPTISCPANVTVNTNAGVCEATGVSLGTPTTADNCSVASTTNDSSEPYALGATTVTWTVTDGSGNTASCAQTVTVADNEAPTAACQNITVQLDANGNATATADQVDNGSSDNCGSVSLGLSQTSFYCSDLNLPTVNDYGEVIVNYVGGTATYVLTEASLVNWSGWSGCSGNQRFISDVNLEGWTWTDNLAPGTVVNSVEINLSFDFSGTGATKLYYLNNVNEGTSPGPPDALDCSSVIKSFTLPGTNYIVGGSNTFSWDLGAYTYVLIKGSVIANAGASVVLTVTDAAGNQSTCNAVVSVEDNINPTITCPADVSVSTDAGACEATNVALGSETAADNCDFTVTNDAPASYPVGTTTVTWTVTDGSGNTASCTQTVTVTDNEAPVITCKPFTINLGNTGGAATLQPFSVYDSGTDNCGSVSLVSVSPNTFDCSYVGQNTVTLTATDNKGNFATCQATVSVNDNIDPTITCPADVSVSTDAGACEATNVALGSETAADNCGFTVTNNAPASYPVGTTTVTWTVTDGSGNTASCVQTVTVADNENPTITCPANVTVAADAGSCEATGVSLGTPATADNCTVASTVNNASEPYALGATTVTWTVTDGGGNTATCTQTVTVQDSEAPTVACPSNTTIQVDASCAATLGSYDFLSVTDNCTGTNTPPTLSFVGGSCGVVDIVLTGAGIAGANQTYPIFSGGQLYQGCYQYYGANGFGIWKENGKWRVQVNQCIVYHNDDISDCPCPPTTGWYAANGCGYNFITTAQSPSPNTVLTGHGTVQQVTLTATDAAGNSAACSFNVTLNDGTPPTITCPASISTTATSAAGATVTYTTPVGTDNCTPTTTQTAGFASGATFPIGTTTNTFEVTDAANNTASCSFDVTITGLAPDITCPANMTVDTDAGLCSAVVSYTATETTAIPASTITYDINPGSTFSLGTTTVTATATNAVGTDQCSFTVTVEDNEAPAALCQGITVQLDINGDISISEDAVNDGSTDACGGLTFDTDITSFGCADVGSNTVTLTVTDNNSNQSTCTATVTVVDNVAPIANCQNITVQLGTNGEASIGEDAVNDGSTDACGGLTFDTDITSFDCADVGGIAVVLTVTDANGNSATCNAIVTVDDLDSDGDGVADCSDNCQFDANADQSDIDVDGIGDVCDATLSVCDAVDALGDYVESLNLPNNTEGFLLNKLDQAKSKYQQGNNNAANGNLNAFINKVNAKTPSEITPAEAAILIATAQAIIDAINSGNTNCNAGGQNLIAPGGSFNATTAAGILELKLFPNPARNSVNIHVHGLGVEGQLIITDQFGRTVWTQELEEDMHAIYLDFSSNIRLISGIYFVSVSTGDQQVVQRLVITR